MKLQSAGPEQALNVAPSGPYSSYRTDLFSQPGGTEILPTAMSVPNEGQPIRLSLRDAVVQSLRNSDVVRVIGANGVNLTSTTLLDPSIAAAQAQRTDATFDPSLALGYSGSRINQPPSSFFGPGIPAGTRRDEGNFNASISKFWATGGSTSFSYNPPLSYLFFPNGTTGGFNPAYESTFIVDVRQPLMRGAGAATNLAPIQIAHLRVDQADWQVKQSTIEQIRSVEETYWGLQAAVVAQQAVTAILPLAEEAVRIQRIRLDNQLITGADLARAESQLKEFQRRRVRADLNVRTNEIRLRNMLGLPLDNTSPLIPIDVPLREPIPLNVDQSVALANAHRPDLKQKRLDVEIRSNEQIVAENGVKPRLDVFAQYRAGGLSDRLDASLNQALSLAYSDWTLGTSFAMPLGNRAPRAARDEALLRSSRERTLLRQMEVNVRYQIAENITTIEATWEQYLLAQQRAAETMKWLDVSRVRFSYAPPAEAGSQDLLTILLVDYQQALQMHLEAVSDAANLLAEYNALNARLEAAQGTLLLRREIWLAGDTPEASIPAQPAAPVLPPPGMAAGHTPPGGPLQPMPGAAPQ